MFSTEKKCYHCHLDVPKEAIWQLDLNDKVYQFCCAGCQAVFSFIHQNELDKANSALKRADEIKRGA